MDSRGVKEKAWRGVKLTLSHLLTHYALYPYVLTGWIYLVFHLYYRLVSFNEDFCRILFPSLSAVVVKCSLTVILIRHRVTPIVICSATVTMTHLIKAMTNVHDGTNSVTVPFWNSEWLLKSKSYLIQLRIFWDRTWS